MHPIKTCSLVLTLGATIVVAGSVSGSSHSDAPLIKQDPQANLTDLYAFIGTRYDDPSQRVLNVVASVRPFSEPGDGPHYERFADDALYSLHITDPTPGRTRLRYDFRFSPVDEARDPDTILSYGRVGGAVGQIDEIGGATQNFVQTYSVMRTLDGIPSSGGADMPVGLPNAGNNVTPLYNDGEGRAVSGAADLAALDAYTAQAITPLAGGEVVFAGPREDGFYADIPGTFDLLNVRILDNNGTLEDGLGQDGNGVDGFKGFNVLTIAVQVPVSMLETIVGKYRGFLGDSIGVGVFSSVSRPAVRTLDENGPQSSGAWVQVNRLGNPLLNEAFMPLGVKDAFNRALPEDDAQFMEFVANPELAVLINATYGTAFAASDRADLVKIFVPDVLRVSTQTGPVTLSGDDGFSRLGFIGGDTTDGISSGWPNGRRFGDDVIDIALTALASGPTYETITLVGDNIAENDALFNAVFPYAATPHSGILNRKDPVSTAALAPGDVDGDGDVDIDDLLFLLDLLSG